MPGSWKDRFKQEISELDQSLSQPKKVSSQDFALYKQKVLELYERISAKVVDIPQIEVSRPIISRSDRYRVDVQGVIETVHALVLRFHEKRLEFHPEGLNFGRSRGRVRLRHNGKGLSRFLYASLEQPSGDPSGDLKWFLLDREQPTAGEGGASERLRPLDDSAIEMLLEQIFLAT
jgi:hypothetical protein